MPTCPVRRSVRTWQCGLLSPAELQRYAVVTCTATTDLDDPRLGPGPNLHATCPTCGGDAMTCPGHMACIVLAEPVYHVLFLPAVARTLARVCPGCHRPNPARRTPCPLCGHTTPPARYTVDGDRLWARPIDPHVPSTVVPARDAATALQAIPVSACAALGWHPVHAHPAWAVVTVLPVLPPAARPYAYRSERSAPTAHPLTVKYRAIVRLNTVLRDALSTAPSHIRRDFIQQLQWHVTTLFDAYETARGAAHAHADRLALAASKDRHGGGGGGGPTVGGGGNGGGLKQRLTGKEGRLRAHLMGKRVDHCARTVISPDPQLALDEVGVPVRIAQRLTMPVRVTAWNVDALMARVARGPDHPDGAMFYTDGAGRRYDLHHFHVAQLRPGDVLERPLTNGDPVLMNRQPTLHRGSMMVHKVRILPRGLTFRLNVSVTTPYNADFDGDEMNLHVPQTWHARSEAVHLLGVQHHLVSPQTNAPVMGLVQDALLALYLLTRGPDTWCDRRDALAWLGAALPDTFPVLPVPAIHMGNGDTWWSGPQLVSVVLRTYAPRVTYTDAHVVVHEGILWSGTLDKTALGPRPGRLLQCLIRTHGTAVAACVLDAWARLGHAFLAARGFSTGMGDCVCDGNRPAAADPVSRPLAAVGHALFARLGPRHGMKAMALAGSKGSMLNMAQIAGCVGQQQQQHAPGTKATAPYAYWPGRPLPHVHRGDTSPAAQGFVAQSFVQGLDPQGFWFHAQSGRDGIIDTACKTATTGYLERKLVKALESVVVAYDGTVRHLAWDHAVVQFVYGDDGYDATALVRPQGQGPPVPYVLETLVDEAARYATDHTPFLVTPSAAVRTKAVAAVFDSTDNVRERTALNACVEAHVATWTTTQLTYVTGECRRRRAHATVAPGEAVGAVAATSLAQPATQLVLNTFHFSGISSKTGNLGVPRLLELLHVSPHPRQPFCTVPRTAWTASLVPDRTVHDVLVSTAVYHGKTWTHTVPWWDTWAYTYGAFPASVRWFVRFRVTVPLDPGLVRRVATHACKGTVLIALSPDACDVVAGVVPRPGVSGADVARRVRHALVHLPVGRLGGGGDGGGSGGHRRHARIVDVEVGDAAIAEANKPTVAVHYVPRATRDREGRALRAILMRTGWSAATACAAIPNDPLATAWVLGIEAARAVLIAEIRTVLAFNGSYVDLRHLQVLADVMTWDGTVRAISRHGCHRRDGVLKQMTFESTVPAVVAAAVRGACDPVTGVSEHVLLGQTVPVGTNVASACLLDTRALARYAVAAPAAAAAAPATRRTGGEVGPSNPFVTDADGGFVANPFGDGWEAAEAVSDPTVPPDDDDVAAMAATQLTSDEEEEEEEADAARFSPLTVLDEVDTEKPVRPAAAVYHEPNDTGPAAYLLGDLAASAASTASTTASTDTTGRCCRRRRPPLPYVFQLGPPLSPGGDDI